MRKADFRHLLEGYNTISDYVLASENDLVIFANNAASEIIGINTLGEPICEIIGEDIFEAASDSSMINKTFESISIADCDFFGIRCTLNVFFGMPSLYIFTPKSNNNTENETEFSPSSLLGFTTEIRKQIAPILFADKNTDANVTKCGYQIIRLVSNFSDYIRLGSRTHMLYFMNTDIVSLCREIASSADEILNIVGTRIQFQSHKPSCIISADSQLIRRAVMNLICNSAKYSRGGNIINISLRFISDQCFLKVSDSGTGISQSDIPNVFNYYKTHQFPRLFGGYGLGLALVRRIALLHGGNAALASKENVGTDVTISFPINKARSVNAEEIVIGSSFNSALLELAEILSVDEFKKAYRMLHTEKMT